MRPMGLMAVALAAAMLSGGCASALVARGSRERVVQRRAIQASALPDGGVAIGVDLLSLDVLTERPLLQVGAAVLDAGLIYGGYRLVGNLTGGNGGDRGDTYNIYTEGGDATITAKNHSEHRSETRMTTTTTTTNP